MAQSVPRLVASRPVGRRPSILVVGGDELTQRTVTTSLAAQYAITTVANQEELVEETNRNSRFESIVMISGGEAISSLRERFPRQPIVHLAPVVTDSLIDHVATDAGVHHVGSAAELREKIYELVRPHRVANRRHPLAGFRASCEGASYSICDLSNDGFAFTAPTGSNIESLLPGSALGAMSIVDEDGSAVLLATGARVAHIAVVPDGYRVGCVFSASEARPSRGRTRRVRGSAPCAAFLRCVLASGQLSLEGIDGSPLLPAVGGKLSTDLRKMTIDAPAHRFERGAVVCGRFEAEGAHYTFVASVQSSQPLEITLPKVIDEIRARDVPRLRLEPRMGRSATLRSPFAGVSATRPIVDISATGVGVLVDPGHDLLPVGTLLPEVVVSLDRCDVRCRGRVCGLAPAMEADGRVRCGIELEGLSDRDRALLGDFVVRARVPGAEDGHGLAFGELWGLLRATGLVTEARASEFEATRSELERTHARLHGVRSQHFQSVILKDDEGLRGYVAGARVYRRTWFLQHLAALPSLLGSYLLTVGPMEHLAQASDAEYFRLCYLAKNKFAARTFGGFGKKYGTTDHNDLRPFHFATMRTNDAWARPPSSLRVTEASSADLAIVERYFVEHERPMLIRSDDLSMSGLTLGEVATAYRRLGLERQRRVLLAFDDETPVGFALAEVSSVGLNVQEHFTSVRTFVLDAGKAREVEVRGELLDAARDLYRRAGRHIFRVFFDTGDVAAHAALGIESQALVMNWTCHRSLFQKVCAHLDRAVRDRALATRRGAA